MKKSSFLTFIFACWPGAGQMYLGYTKRGASLMTAFVTVLGVAGFLDLWFFSILLPVIWFFAFFDAFAIRNMTPEEAAAKPDDFIVPPELRNRAGAQEIAHRYHLALGIGLIVIGVYILYNSFFLSLFANLLNALPYDLNWLWRIASNLPTLAVAILLVLFGLRLMRGGRKKEKPDELVEFKGDD